MEQRDLRKDATDALRSLKGEVKGLVLIATDKQRVVACSDGQESTIVSMLAITILNDPRFAQAVQDAIRAASIKMAGIAENN